jgi:hypothetical protein
MGQVHTICETRSDVEFLVNNQYTGEKTLVTVEQDKWDLFFDKSIFLDEPDACPFLRYRKAENKAYCTVHLTRPEICRDYGCWRLLILNSQGTRSGRIMYRRAFFSDDIILTQLWNECIDTLEEPDDELWDEKITRLLINAGYTVRK